MKLDAQLKIAELERRIAALESAANAHGYVKTYEAAYSHWDKMWQEFDLVMKSAFGAIRGPRI